VDGTVKINRLPRSSRRPFKKGPTVIVQNRPSETEIPEGTFFCSVSTRPRDVGNVNGSTSTLRRKSPRPVCRPDTNGPSIGFRKEPTRLNCASGIGVAGANPIKGANNVMHNPARRRRIVLLSGREGACPWEHSGCSHQQGPSEPLPSGRQRCSLSFVLVLLAQLPRWQWGKLHFNLSEHPLSSTLDEQTRAQINVGPIPKHGGRYAVTGYVSPA
jgi:hypothetical protein